MFIYTTDWHLSDDQPINRSGNIFNESFVKIEQLFIYANANQSCIIHGGDIFHKACVSYDVVNRLIELIKKYNIKLYTVVGNHDLLGNNIEYTGTSIYTLFKSQVIFPLEFLELDGLKIEGINYHKDLVYQDSGKADIVVAHLPIVSTSVPYDHIKCDNINTNARLVLCGHIHESFIYKCDNTTFINPGCFVRRSIKEKDVSIKAIGISNGKIIDINIDYIKDVFNTKIKDEDIKSIINFNSIKTESVCLQDIIESLSIDIAVKDEIKRRLKLLE